MYVYFFREEVYRRMSGLRMSHREKLASIMKHFQTVGLKTVLLKLCISMYAMLKSWKGNCVFGLISVPWVCTDSAFVERIFFED